MEKGSTYWTFKRVLGLSSGIGIPIIALFTYLALSGALNVTGYDYTPNCAGTPSDLCYLYINATPTKTIYIQADSQWLDTTPPIKTIKLQRSWGSSWRTIDLTKPWSSKVKYALKLNKGQDYQFRFIAEKYDPRDVINWSINPNGKWDKAKSKIEYKYENVTTIEHVKHYKDEEVCYDTYKSTKCVKDVKDKKDYYVNVSGCYDVKNKCYKYKTIDYIEQVNITKLVKVKNSGIISYAESKFEYGKEGYNCKDNKCDKWCDGFKGETCIDLPDSNGDGICTQGESDCIELEYTDKIEKKK